MMVLGKGHAMTTLENAISLIRILPETDLDEIQNFRRKTYTEAGSELPFCPKSREDIYKDLEAAHQQIASGEYQDADRFIVGIKKEYGI